MHSTHHSYRIFSLLLLGLVLAVSANSCSRKNHTSGTPSGLPRPAVVYLIPPIPYPPLRLTHHPSHPQIPLLFDPTFGNSYPRPCTPGNHASTRSSPDRRHPGQRGISRFSLLQMRVTGTPPVEGITTFFSPSVAPFVSPLLYSSLKQNPPFIRAGFVSSQPGFSQPIT